MEDRLRELDEKIENLKNEKSIEEVDSNTYVYEKGKVYKEYKKKEESIVEFKKVIENSQSFNLKMDAIFEILHISVITQDIELMKEYIELSKKMLKEGGDWEKKNKLKVYDGLYNLSLKNFKESGKLFVEALMTFTNYELFDYKDFVFYTAITNIITVDRATLKNKIIDNSDVVSCIRDIPHLQNFLDSFYDGNYLEFFKEFYNIIQRTKTDFFLSKHNNYFIKEMRIKVYNQYLRNIIY